MKRVIAVTACGLALAACSTSMPSLDFFKSTPPTEVLRVESEPPGADARTSQGQSCRTPCELTVQTGGEIAVTYALNGYQPQTLQVRPEVPPTSYGETGTGTSGRLQPNPVYAELQPIKPPPKKKRPAVKHKQSVKRSTPAPATAPATTASVPATTASAPTTARAPSAGLQSSYPWPDPQPLR
jgi:hypothetical protein